jgi:type IV secretion system protein VirB11
METIDAKVVRQLLSPISPFLSDPCLFEVVINQPGEVWTEGTEGWVRHEMEALSVNRLQGLARAIASFSQQAIDETRPLLSATLPDGERIQIAVSPAVLPGTVSMTIRKPSVRHLSLADLAESGLFKEAEGLAQSPQAQANACLQAAYAQRDYRLFLEEAVRSRLNIIISGATGSGKTTLSKALIQHIPLSERIITIEDTAELIVPQRNHVRLFYSKGQQGLAALGPKELLEAALRMRPDRVLLQELRDGSAFYYLRAVSSGHPGSITTVHASSVAIAIEQITLLIKEAQAGAGLDRQDARNLLMSVIDVVVQCRRNGGSFSVSDVWWKQAATGN